MIYIKLPATHVKKLNAVMANQKLSEELIAEVQDWFAQHSPNGEIPEESTTRKKVAPIWRALRERE